MSNTITETLLQERLKPVYQNPRPLQFQQGKTLLRSSSFYKLREFPAYLCRKGSSDVFHWLLNFSSKLSCILANHQKQVRRFLLGVLVYSVILVLFVEAVALCLALAEVARPAGLLFLIACIGAMASLALLLARPHINQCIQQKLKHN